MRWNVESTIRISFSVTEVGLCYFWSLEEGGVTVVLSLILSVCRGLAAGKLPLDQAREALPRPWRVLLASQPATSLAWPGVCRAKRMCPLEPVPTSTSFETIIHIPSGTAGTPCPSIMDSDFRACAGLFLGCPHDSTTICVPF